MVRVSVSSRTPQTSSSSAFRETEFSRVTAALYSGDVGGIAAMGLGDTNTAADGALTGNGQVAIRLEYVNEEANVRLVPQGGWEGAVTGVDGLTLDIYEVRITLTGEPGGYTGTAQYRDRTDDGDNPWISMGSGPVQQMPESPPDVPEQKRLAASYFDDPPPAGALSGLSKKPGFGEDPHAYDPGEIVWRRHPERPRVPRKDPEPAPEPGPLGPVSVPAGRPPPRPPQKPELPGGGRPTVPKSVKPVFEDPVGRAAPVGVQKPPSDASALEALAKLGAATRPTRRRRIGGGQAAPPQPPQKPPGGPSDTGMPPADPRKKRRISWGKDRTKEFTGGRHTPGRVMSWVPGEREKHQGYQQLGQMQGRERARLEHQIVLEQMQRRNRGLIQQMQQGMGQQGLRAQRAEERVGHLLQEGRSLEAQGKQQIRGLQEGMGRQGLRAQRAEQRVGQLTQEGRSLEAVHKARMKRGGEQIAARDKAYGALKTEANRRIQSLEKRINDGSADRSAAQKEIDALTKQLAAAAARPEAKAPEQKQDLSGLRSDLAELRKAIAARPKQQAAAPAAAPIVVQGGAGGGGASSAGGSSAASGGGAPAAAAPDLSKVVEAIKQIAEGAKKKGAGSGTKGITQARRTYTDKRKAKIAELRALKSKRIREFAAKTKKLPKAERQKQRREYRKRVEAQFKEMQTRFPTARGLKSVGVIRELIRKISAFKSAK